MLMFMTGNRAAAAEASASPGDQGPQGASTWLPKSLLEVVESSDAPLAAVELPSGRILAANAPLARALGSTIDALTDSSSLEQWAPEERHAVRLGFQALADGDLAGYQAIRRLANTQDPGKVFSVWVSVVDVDGARIGLVSAIPSAGQDNQLGAPPPLPRVPESADMVLGTVDSSWRIDRISRDVTPLLGIKPDQCVGAPVLGVIHPSDAPAFCAAVEHARRGERGVRLGLRLAAGSHDWTEVTVVLATTSPDDPPPLAFAVIRDDLGADPPAEGTRQMQLETHMLRIADELRAAGMIPRLEQLPALTEIPQLGDLTSREWEVLTGLLNGQRVSDIAAELYVSQSTVRNHLSSIYARLGVHSQVDLVRLIRQGTKQPAGNPQDE